MIAPIDSIPSGATRRPRCVLAEGEVTGHSHRVEGPGGAELLEDRGMLYLRVLDESATVIHQEHQPIALPRGLYRVWQQREYTPQAIRTVRD